MPSQIVEVSSARPERYLFDLDLMGGGHSAADLRSRQMVEAIAAARAEGHAAGYREGQAGAEAQAAAMVAGATAGLVEAFRTFISASDMEFERVRQDASMLALAAARQLAGAMVSREPTGEIAALLEECLCHLDGAPSLLVRMRSSDAEAIRATLASLVEQTGFAGRLTILAEDAIAPGDCHIEWAEGGLIRDTEKAYRAMTAALARRFGEVGGLGDDRP